MQSIAFIYLNAELIENYRDTGRILFYSYSIFFDNDKLKKIQAILRDAKTIIATNIGHSSNIRLIHCSFVAPLLINVDTCELIKLI